MARRSAYLKVYLPLHSLNIKPLLTVTLGAMVGASFLNENFKNLMMEKLSQEHYLEEHGATIESIVDHLVPAFESHDKREKDACGRPSDQFWILGLRANPDKNFKNGPLLVDP